MNDHLSASLRAKIKYLKNFPVEISNDKPGGILVITVYYDDSRGSGRVFTQSEIEDAISYAEQRKIERGENH